MIVQIEPSFLHDSAVASQPCPYGSDNTVYAVRPSGSPKRLRHFANTQTVVRNSLRLCEN